MRQKVAFLPQRPKAKSERKPDGLVTEGIDMSDRQVSASDRQVSASDREVSVSDQEVSALDREVSASDREVSASDREDIPTKSQISGWYL